VKNYYECKITYYSYEKRQQLTLCQYFKA